MKKTIIERNIAVALFLLVLIVFSFAERDSKKLNQLYSKKLKTSQVVKKENKLASAEPAKASTTLTTRN
jgi:hypothetical protein